MTTRQLRTALTGVLAFFVGIVATAVHAEPVKDQVYAVPSVMLIGEDDEQDYNGLAAPGIGLGYQLTERWGVEVHYMGGETEQEGVPGSDINVNSVRLDGVFNFGGENWKILGVAGIGSYEYDSGVNREDNNTLINVGMGVMRSITERLAVRGDARLMYIDDSEEVLPTANLALRYVLSGPTSPMPSGDADGDGVPDRDDRCPDTPPGVDVDASGCARDGDRDGVPDSADACPRTPAGVSVDSRGCALDGDRDGVPDHLDACPQTPRGDEVDERGCTIEEEEEVVSARIELNLEFDFDSDALRPEHYSEIERVAEFMNEYPGTTAQLEGHTDSRGTEAYNQALSERRAYSVRDYLIDESDIDPRRITAVGYGESDPVATNDTDEGRQRNRRVNAVIETREMSVRPRRQN